MAASATSAASARSRRPLTSPGAAVRTIATTPPPKSFMAPVVSRPARSARRWPPKPRSSSVPSRSSIRPRKANAKQANSTTDRRRLSLSSSPTPNSASAVRAASTTSTASTITSPPAVGQLVAAVVACGAAPGARAPGRGARSSSEGGDDAAREQQHVGDGCRRSRPTAARPSGPGLTGSVRTVRYTSEALTTPSITPGTAMPESLKAKPRNPTTARPGRLSSMVSRIARRCPGARHSR